MSALKIEVAYVNSIHSLFYYCADCQYQSQFDAVKNGEAEILSLMEYTNKKKSRWNYQLNKGKLIRM